MTNFKEYFIDKQINIYIPALQRDYVQGANIDIITPFLSVLSKALSTKSEKVKLNYIYGYNKESFGFIPIDGQQRLITLWLVHLYLYSKQSKTEEEIKFPKLSFESREYADNFSSALLEHLSDISLDITDGITDASWFISSWLDDITVVNMIKTLNSIKNIFKDNKEQVYWENISFYFKDLRDSKTNISDDIYLKMNGRGRALSYYDNFKSLIDSKLDKLDSDISTSWRDLIDNDWTDLFWRNRNKKQEFSENIDDEQMRLFYSLMLIYYLTDKDKLSKQLKQLKKDNNLSINDFEIYLGCDGSSSKSGKDLVKEDSIVEDVSKDIINKLLKGNAIPLYWLEHFNLINGGSIRFIFDAMNVFIKLEDRIIKLDNDKEPLPVKLFLENKDEQTNFYIIALKNATYSNTLPYLYSIIKTPQSIIENTDNGEDFKRYIRIIRNLVINTDGIQFENIHEFFKAISSISSALNDEKKPFYQKLTNLQKNVINVFDKTQIEEEIQKINKLNDVYNNKNKDDFEKLEKTIFEAEQSLFLIGGINFLYLNSEAKEEWGSFYDKYERFREYFKNTEENETKIKNEYINKIMQAYCNLNRFDFKKIKFTNYKSSWRKILTNKVNIDVIHKILTKENLDDLIFTDNVGDLTRVQQRLRTLINDKSQFFINFLFGTCGDNKFSIWERLNESLIVIKNERTYIVQEGKRCGLIVLSAQKRDKILFNAKLNGKIEFLYDINNELVNHFKSIGYISTDDIQTYNYFFYHWNDNITFKYNNEIFSWEEDDKIWKRENDKWNLLKNDEKDNFILKLNQQSN